MGGMDSAAGGPLRPDDDHDGETFTGDLTGQHAENTRFLECTFRDCDLSEVRAPRARFAETSWYAVRGAGVDLAESTWLDCVVSGGRLGAVQLHGAELRRVRFEGCKIEFLNLRSAKLADCEFVDCQLVEPDFSEASLTGVGFSGTRLVSADFRAARLTSVDLTGAELVAPSGLTGLKGATVSRLQLIDLADALATELGITVAD